MTTKNYTKGTICQTEPPLKKTKVKAIAKLRIFFNKMAVRIQDKQGERRRGCWWLCLKYMDKKGEY
jgi:hypothetical protein